MNLKHLSTLPAKLIDRYFIADHLKDGGLNHWKARLLAAIHLFIFVIAIVIEITSDTFEHGRGTPGLLAPLLLVIPTFFIFKKYGNFIVSGNILAAIVAFVLHSAVYETGGIYSDNLLWMVTVPLLALLFANRISGFLWLLGLIFFAFHLFILDQGPAGVYRAQTEGFDSLYFLISYTGLFIMVVAIVLVFATGQEMIVKILDEKRAQLTAQKEELVRQAESLRKAKELLRTSNQELEQFAYAASHDLKEPLRMIGMYTQLIKKRLQNNLDEPTQEYMYFVTDGVSRMERLLHDLLEYSRLGKKRDRDTETDLNEILLVVVNNLMAAMKESDAEIMANELPVLKASSTEMVQLFQNLIANSIKFRRKEEVPVIQIDHQIEDDTHQFRFQDNGIGISEEYREKVFHIFERVHSKQDYEGTGIGLATCKKIVNNMGGDIWVDAETTEGTTFIFTVPTSSAAQAS